MKRALTLLVALLSGAAFAAIDFSGVTALADRLGGTALTTKVTFTEWMGETGDKAQIIPGDGAFTIKATSVHAASLALGTYLRDVAKGHISWCGKRMPTDWALPTVTIDVAPRYPHAMAYNYCTLSYTMAYWSKEAWQNEIDRLALSGYTTALCMAGVQKIWKLTMEELGYTKQQQQDFIVDDAQQAWWLMGNLQAIGNGTPQGHYPIVSDEEIEKDAEIGKFIVKQMRAVGIEPVLQAFIGLVPSTTTAKQLADHFGYDVTDATKVNIIVNGYYNEGHKNPDLIDPTCAVFEDFSAVWNKHLKTVYGMTDAKDYPKYLGGDLFHESAPPSSMTYEQQVNCTKFIQAYQQEAFPGVTWVLQNWQRAPVQNLRDGLDPQYTVIQRLDQSMNATDARTTSYVNNQTNKSIPWVWVEVMNFGGNTGMHGAFKRFRSVGNLGGNDSFKGYGLLSEGLETNPVSYDMYHWAMVQSTQDQQNIDDDELEPWLEAYRQRRYGYTDDNLKAAHTILANTVWTCKQDQQGTMESVFCAKPAYNVTKVSAWGPTTGTPYDRKELIIAAEYFLETAKSHPELLNLETFRYDFVEIFQQILADKAREMIPDCATSQKRRDEFRQMLELVDRILACSDEWRLDAKENRLKGKAPTTGPAAYRRLITTWTPGGRHQTQLSQYAHRSYAGLVKNYYAKKWNAFFDVTEGAMSQAAYNTLCDTLDEEFPTTELPATPTDGDPVAIAEEILALIAPPAITWTGATDNMWEHANWNDAKGQAAEWENGKSVILSGMNKTITTAGAISVGNIALENAAVNADNQGWIDPTTAIVIAANTTIEDAHTWDYAGIMSGGWFGSPVQRQCAATGFHKSDITTTDNVKSFTIQFQAIDFSDNVNWLKAVSAKIYQDGADVKIVSTGTGAQNGGTLGSGPLSGGSAPASSSGYCIKQIVTHRPSVVTVTGSVVVEGEVTLNDGEALALPGATAIDTISIEKGTATLGLGATQDLAINVMLLGSDAKLILKGSAETLQGAAGATKVKLPKSALTKVVYVGPDGEEQALKLDAEGYAKTKIGTLSYTGAISEKVNLGWKNVTLDDLCKMVYTNQEGTKSTQIRKEDDCVKFVIGNNQSEIVLEINEEGFVTAKTSKGIYDLLAEPAVASVELPEIDLGAGVGGETLVYDQGLPIYVTQIPWVVEASVLATYTFTLGDEIGKVNYSSDTFSITFKSNYLTLSVGKNSVRVVAQYATDQILTATPPSAGATRAQGVVNYTSLTDAITAANGEAKVTLLDDATVTASINNNYKTWIEIPRGLTLTATCGDFIWWDKAYTLDIYGTLDLGGNALSVGTTKSHEINLYAGGEIKSTNAKGLAIFAANTAINVKANDGFDTATLNTPVQARENTTISVEEDVTAVLNGNIVLKAGGESGTATPIVTKTGAGTLEFNGVIATGATLVLSEGTLKRVMPVGDTLVVTVNGGTTDITADNADAKIVETVEGAVHTFTCVEKAYRYRVTDPGEISVNMPGTNYETLAEAIDAAQALQDANRGEIVNIWVISQEVEAQAQADLAAYNEEHGTSMTLFGDGNGIVIKDWPKPSIGPASVTYYFPAGVTEWNSSTKVATSVDGEANVTVKANDVIYFANGGTMPSDTANLYITSSVATKEMKITDDTTVRLGSESGNKINLRDGWKVTIDEGSSLILRGWGNGNTADIHLEGTVTLNGNGVVTIDASDAPTAVWNNVKGTATITIPSGVTVTVTGSIENPITGAGTIKISGEQSLTFAADSAVTVQHENITQGYYAVTSVVENLDGTTTKTYAKVENIGATAFGINWYDSDTGSVYVGPETAGGDAKWDVGANWLSVDKDGVVGARRTVAPYKGNPYNYSLFNGDYISNVTPDANGVKHITADSLDFWRVRLGLTNKVDVTINEVTKMQKSGDTYIRVDPTSKLTIKKVTIWKGETIDLHSAAPEGIVFEGINGNVWNFYLEGAGTVQFNCKLSGSHTVKAADVDLGSGECKHVLSKKLVGFTSIDSAATVTLATDAKITAADGTTMTAGEVSATAEVGTYALRTGTDGVYLDYVARRGPKVAYYKSGYVGNETSLALTETSGGTAATYEDIAAWNIVIDSNSPDQAWAADSYKYSGNIINVTKFIVEKNFTLKNGIKTTIFGGITFDVASGAKLTLADSAANQKMTLGTAHFTGAGEVDISGVSTWTTVTASEGMTVTYASSLKVKTTTVDGVTTYMVSTDPTSWEDVDKTTPLEKVIPTEQAAKLAEKGVTADAIKDWVATGKGYGVTIDFNPAVGIDLEAFALGTYTEYKEATKANFKLSFSIDKDGNPVPELSSWFVENCNIKPVIKGSTDLKTWHEKTEGDKFFKAVIEL